MFKVMGASIGIRLQLPKKLELNNSLLDVYDLVYLYIYIYFNTDYETFSSDKFLDGVAHEKHK